MTASRRLGPAGRELAGRELALRRRLLAAGRELALRRRLLAADRELALRRRPCLPPPGHRMPPPGHRMQLVVKPYNKALIGRRFGQRLLAIAPVLAMARARL
jgi:hypothetical protein